MLCARVLFVRQPTYYGWKIAFTLAFTETVSWGIVFYAFTVFMTPMESDLGWTRAELTGGYSLALLLMGAMAFPVGVWIDRHGARLLMTVGSVAASGLVIAWSQVTDIRAFYLIWAGLGVCMAMILYEPAFAVIATWFRMGRGRALAVITFAAGLASTIFVPLSDLLLRHLGWRSAVLVLGIALLVCTPALHALVLRRRPADLGLLPDGVTGDASTAQGNVPARQPVDVSLRGAVGSPAFWVLTGAFGLSVLASSAIRVHFIPYLTDAGIDSSTAALASGAIGLMQVVGRVAFAPLEARVSSRGMVMGVFGLQTIAMCVLVGAALPGLPMSAFGLLVVLFIITFGASYGAKTLARASILADEYGTAAYGRISSIMALASTVAATAAPVGAGLLYEASGSYDGVVWIVIGLSGAATLSMVAFRPAVARG